MLGSIGQLDQDLIDGSNLSKDPEVAISLCGYFLRYSSHLARPIREEFSRQEYLLSVANGYVMYVTLPYNNVICMTLRHHSAAWTHDCHCRRGRGTGDGLPGARGFVPLAAELAQAWCVDRRGGGRARTRERVASGVLWQ